MHLLPRSLIQQVYESLLADLLSGKYLPGDQIPTEEKLQEIYGVSRATIREAVGQLVAAGLLRRRQGRGTFVQLPDLQERVGSLGSFAHVIRARGMVPAVRVFSCQEMSAPSFACRQLGLPPGSIVTVMERLRLAGDEPVALSRDYVPVNIAPGLGPECLVEESLYRGLEVHYGIQLRGLEEEVEAVMPTAVESRVLQMPADKPLLFRRITTYGTTQSDRTQVRAVDYVEIVYRGDRFRLRGSSGLQLLSSDDSLQRAVVSAVEEYDFGQDMGRA